VASSPVVHQVGRLYRRAGVARLSRAVFGESLGGQWAYDVLYWLAAPGRPRVGLSWPRRAQLLKRGFLPPKHALFELDVHDWREYLSDRERERTRSIDGPLAILLGDKVAFSLLMERLGAPVAAVEAVVIQGRAIPFDGEEAGWLRRRLADGDALVLKPARGGGGHGILLLRGGPDGPTLNGEALSWEALEARIAELDDVVATPHVRQAAYAARIHPPTTNTMRVLTMLDREGAPFVAAATHRFGTARSTPVDNCGRGGLSVELDPETGRLGPAAVFPDSGIGRLRWVTHHPDTGEAIDGVTVPGWARIRDGILELAARTRFLPYVGWDVVATDGGHVVLEGNHYSAAELQVHQGLLRDPRVRDFYRRHGIPVPAGRPGLTGAPQR
jgi:Sugar-transfer associated ATP-grasp